MIDIKLFNKALKSSWITKYLDSENHGKWKLLFDLELQSFGGEGVSFRGNLSKEHLSKHFKIYFYFRNSTNLDVKYEANIYSTEQLKAQNLSQNSLMQVGNKPIHYKSWSSNEGRNVGHLMKLIRRIFYSLRILNVFLSKQTFLLSKGDISD